MPVIVSILFFLLFHITSITGEKLIKQGELGLIAGMWLATFILSPIGIFLTYKASTDASFLQFDFYRDVLKRFMTFFQGKSKK